MGKQFGMPPIVRHEIKKVENGWKENSTENYVSLEDRSVRVDIYQNEIDIVDRETGNHYESKEIFRNAGVDDVTIDAKTLTDHWRIVQKKWRSNCVLVPQEA